MTDFVKRLAVEAASQILGQYALPVVFITIITFVGSIYWPLWGWCWGSGIALSAATLAAVVFGVWRYERTIGDAKRAEESQRKSEQARRATMEKEMTDILTSLDPGEMEILRSFTTKNTQGLDITEPTTAGLVKKNVLMRAGDIGELDQFPVMLSPLAKKLLPCMPRSSRDQADSRTSADAPR